MAHDIKADLAKYERAVSPALRKFAAGQDCTIRLRGCRRMPEYTIAAHLRFFGVAGISQKPSDIHMVFACDRCHDILDHRDRWRDHDLTWRDVLRALMFSQTLMEKSGLIQVKGG